MYICAIGCIVLRNGMYIDILSFTADWFEFLDLWLLRYDYRSFLYFYLILYCFKNSYTYIGFIRSITMYFTPQTYQKYITPKIDNFDLLLHVTDTCMCLGVILPKEDKLILHINVIENLYNFDWPIIELTEEHSLE